MCIEASSWSVVAFHRSFRAQSGVGPPFQFSLWHSNCSLCHCDYIIWQVTRRGKKLSNCLSCHQGVWAIPLELFCKHHSTGRSLFIQPPFEDPETSIKPVRHCRSAALKASKTAVSQTRLTHLPRSLILQWKLITFAEINGTSWISGFSSCCWNYFLTSENTVFAAVLAITHVSSYWFN